MSDIIVDKILNLNSDSESVSLNNDEYIDIFNNVQRYVVSHKLSELNESLNTKNMTVLASIVTQYLKSTLSISDNVITDRIIDDMTGYGFLNNYFADSSNIEEINIDSWDCIWVRYTDWTYKRIPETFLSPKHAKDVMLRILNQHNKHLDENTLKTISYVSKNIRIATAIPPLVDEEVGIIASIRFIHPAKHTMTELVSHRMLLPQSADLLNAFIDNGISFCICGLTNSGKTTLANAILQDNVMDNRIVTIEAGTREFDLARYDQNGTMMNDVVHLQTRENKDDFISVDQQALLDFAMKLDPDILVVGEMVSEEAFVAQEASQTGHTVLTTIHSKSAYEAYYRMFTLGLRKYRLDENIMMRLMVNAFPIIVQVKTYKDHKRRVQTILEGQYQNGEVIYRTLYKFKVIENVVDEKGKVIDVRGQFVKVHEVSDTLKERMHDNGLTEYFEF